MIKFWEIPVFSWYNPSFTKFNFAHYSQPLVISWIHNLFSVRASNLILNSNGLSVVQLFGWLVMHLLWDIFWFNFSSLPLHIIMLQSQCCFESVGPMVGLLVCHSVYQLRIHFSVFFSNFHMIAPTQQHATNSAMYLVLSGSGKHLTFLHARLSVFSAIFYSWMPNSW